MSVTILGEKQSQSQRFTSEGKRIPTTFLKTSPCYLVEVKTAENKGYNAIKLAFGKTKNFAKSVKGQLTKAGIEIPLHFLREIRFQPERMTVVEENGKKAILNGENKCFVGEELKASSLFAPGDRIKVSGISKGKGFQGVVKRHGFAGGPRTHGQSDRERAPGAIGSSTTPGRIYKGKRMAGRMGGERTSVRNLTVVEVNDQGMVVKGVVPGAKGGLIEIQKLS